MTVIKSHPKRKAPSSAPVVSGQKIASLAALAMATPCLEIKTINMMPTTEELQCKTESALTKMDLPGRYR